MVCLYTELVMKWRPIMRPVIIILISESRVRLNCSTLLAFNILTTNIVLCTLIIILLYYMPISILLTQQFMRQYQCSYIHLKPHFCSNAIVLKSIKVQDSGMNRYTLVIHYSAHLETGVSCSGLKAVYTSGEILLLSHYC